MVECRTVVLSWEVAPGWMQRFIARKPQNLHEGRIAMRRTTKHIISVILLAGFSMLPISAYAVDAATVKGVITGDPINIDPPHLHMTQDRIVAQHVFQGLVTFDLTADPPYPVVPVLAESYEISEDGKVITFKLHKEVQFHHGYGELTSEDVVFNLLRHLDKKTASRARSQLKDIERVKAPDKYTVTVYLKVSSAVAVLQNLAYQTAGFIVSKKAVTKLGDKVQRLPIGTGPFFFDRWDPGEKVVLKKFDSYWGASPKIDVIEFWVIPEEIVALGALQKGDLDIVPVTQLGSYNRAKGIKNVYFAESKGGARIYIYYLNHKKKPMDDVRVRRALAHALDIEGICKRIGPQVMAFPSPLAPIVFGATDEFWDYEYNVEKAKQLLTEAGYPNGFEFKLIYNRAGLYEPIALEVQSSLNKVVDVKLELVERAVFRKTLKQYEHHAAAWGKARYAPSLFADSYESKSSQNYSNYSNPSVDRAVKKSETAASEQEAKKYWREFQRLVTEDVVNFWVANGKSLVLARNSLKHVIVMPTPGLYILDNARIAP
jgi:peptide/nickel transport system substrate-binding protein